MQIFLKKKFRAPVNFIPHYADFCKKIHTPVNFIPHYKKRLVRFCSHSAVFSSSKNRTREILAVVGFSEVYLLTTISLGSKLGKECLLVVMDMGNLEGGAKRLELLSATYEPLSIEFP